MGRVADFFGDQKITLAMQQKQQMLALDKEFVSLESQVTTLKAENLKLRAEVEPLKREVQRLKDQVEKSKAHDGRLDEISEKMLALIANDAGAIREIVAQLHLTIAKGGYHVDILEKRNFILEGSVSFAGTFYMATPEGREYLASHGLL